MPQQPNGIYVKHKLYPHTKDEYWEVRFAWTGWGDSSIRGWDNILGIVHSQAEADAMVAEFQKAALCVNREEYEFKK